MIIGKGLIGKSLLQYDMDGFVFVAAGVSDSKCTDASEFKRERDLVENIISKYNSNTIVFFSTYSINDTAMVDTMYVKHKKQIEDYIVANARSYHIIRISNLVGDGGNVANIFNFLFNKIKNGEPFKMWANAERNLIMAEDFAFILHKIITEKNTDCLNTISNIINSVNYKVIEIVKAIEMHLNKKAIFELVDISSVANFKPAADAKWFNEFILPNENYLERILQMHYSKFSVSI